MENWKTIEDFESYEVSDLGRIRRRLPTAHPDGAGNSKVGMILRLYSNIKTGYIQVWLSKDGKVKGKYVHVLVAQAFIPNPLNLPEVNHLGSKSDCRYTMLEWRTKAGNHRHSAVTGRSRGDGIHFNKAKNKYIAGYAPTTGKWKQIGGFATYDEAKSAREDKMDALEAVL